MAVERRQCPVCGGQDLYAGNVKTADGTKRHWSCEDCSNEAYGPTDLECAKQFERWAVMHRERVAQDQLEYRLKLTRQFLPQVASGAATGSADSNLEDRGDWCLKMADYLARAFMRHEEELWKQLEEER